ncbi:hypothetical protein [Blastococcus sp. CT_GayMR16]|uniref:hypothetical protein n=1 Tax=Blastococcus sp. CT_GayMR16 TaxID=2559607 RepID=UPI0010741594|nr:hypothetical protein [Blastococcus sp. CT_GayMR16]TFV86427.1 hypothetical protein E4P38_16885 [Blastococcus sp. CT_GayMR16]
MTSGQGENQPGGPYGPPQGWNAPPPPGPQYPGYAPAPSAPTGYGGPQSMERPTTVRAGIGAFVASLLVGLISSAVTFADFDAFVARAMAASSDTPDVTEDLIRTSLMIGIVVGLVFVALEVLFLWFAWKGHQWARIVLWVLGGLSLTFGLIGLAGSSGQTGFTTSMGAFGLLFTAAGVLLLAMKPSNEWYRFRSWQRATGQG